MELDWVELSYNTQLILILKWLVLFNPSTPSLFVTMVWHKDSGTATWRGGAREENAPYGFQKREKLEDKKIYTLKGLLLQVKLYKGVSFRGFTPWPPLRGSYFWTPKISLLL